MKKHEWGLDLTAIILAGGQSSRMGQDKALITVDGVPLIRRVYNVAHQCAQRVYVVTPWVERYRPMLPPTCQFVQEVPLSGQEPHGPLVGFAQGLSQVETGWVLLLACDLPRLEAGVLQTAIATLEQVPDDAIALLPRHENGWEPLCGFYRRRCLPGLMGFVEQGGRSFQHWLAHYSVAELSLTNPNILFNCNTPADVDCLTPG